MTSSTHSDPEGAADEGTHLLLSAPKRPANENPSQTSSTTTISSNSKHQHARQILLSTTLTRLGSRSWEFATPLLLLEWSPGSLAAPAALGLTCAFARTTISPWLGGRADAWNSRMDVVMVGAGMQALGCLVSVGALIAWNACDGGRMKMPLLALVICAGVVETLGAQLASVAVKKEWVPIVFDEKNDDSSNNKHGGENEGVDATTQAMPVTGNKRHFPFSLMELPPINLSFINTSMTNIDLLCAMFGPVLAGWILEVLGGGNDQEPQSMQQGFAAIALINVISFVPEIYLLQRVYRTCPALQQRSLSGLSNDSPKSNNNEKEGEDSDEAGNNANKNTQQRNSSSAGEPINPWIIWFHHPSGLPLVTISLAALYLTALSPSGVVLTAYLVTIGLSPTSIGMFRAIGSFSGVVGIGLFSMCRKCGDGDDIRTEERAERSASVQSIRQLRRMSMAFLLLEVISVLVAAVAHFLCETSDLISSASMFGKDGSEALPWQIVLFLSAIVVSRAGLYSFDVGALEIEQYIVDERHRNAVGSVEGALCSLCEMGMYVLSIALPDPAQFGVQVMVSASAVTTGGICFASFLHLYHMHRHYHCPNDEDDPLDCHDHQHNHMHTLQQERDLKEFGYHIHLHRSSPSLHCMIFKKHQQ